MKKLIPIAASTFAVGAAIFLGGCETDGAAPKAGAVAFADFDLGPAPAGVKTVRVTIDSSPPDANVQLNGVSVGYTPREVHLEVDDKGRLAYAVQIDVVYRTGSQRQGTSTAARTADGHKNYATGVRIPSRVDFSGDFVVENTKPAPWDSKPTAPSTSNSQQSFSPLPPTGSGAPAMAP